jgi:Fe-S cluster assembly ATPase SufC
VLSKGRIVASGGPELAAQLEETGYAAYGEVPAKAGPAADDPFADPLA